MISERIVLSSGGVLMWMTTMTIVLQCWVLPFDGLWSFIQYPMEGYEYHRSLCDGHGWPFASIGMWVSRFLQDKFSWATSTTVIVNVEWAGMWMSNRICSHSHIYILNLIRYST
mmetsp:Transcript_3712/g.4276  ORF Transcript_3712/g.4276 Transcript_3712/m.4276 type:complete len:114 (+) Transcript_3712:421-762(+)